MEKKLFMTCAYLMNTATTNKVTTIPNDENITGIIPQMLVNSRCLTGSSSQAVLLESGREPFGHWKQVNSSTKICSYKVLIGCIKRDYVFSKNTQTDPCKSIT